MIGGLGGAVTDGVQSSYPVPVVRAGIADHFTELAPTSTCSTTTAALSPMSSPPPTVRSG